MNTAQDIVFQTSEIAYAIDRSGRLVLWNDAAESAFGWSRSDAVGKRCWELLGGKDAFGNPYCCQGCPVKEAAFSQSAVNRFHLKFKTAVNGRKGFHVSALLLKGESGAEILVHLCRDDPTHQVNGHKNGQHNGNGHWGGTHSAHQQQAGHLTSREHEVLAMLAEGHGTREISTLRSISIHTVRNHVQNILAKLQVNSRLQAINLGRRLDLI